MIKSSMESTAEAKPAARGPRSFEAGLHSPWLPSAVILIALGVLGAIVLLSRRQLREEVRQQIVARDAAVLHEVALMPTEDATDGSTSLMDINDPATQLTILLRTSRLRGVLAARLFDASGSFVQSFPVNVREAELPEEDFGPLQRLEPVARFHPALRLSELVFLLEPGTGSSSAVPIVEIAVPLHSRAGKELAGIAQFWIEGNPVAAEFARLEAHLDRQAWLAFGAGGALLTASLLLAFHRLRRSHMALERQSQALLEANRELVAAAKTSAVGALTTHLVHDLKNPLSGLCNYLQTTASTLTQADPALQDALSASRRMQTTIQEIVSMLREEQYGIIYQLPLEELAQVVEGKLRSKGSSRGVRIVTQVQGTGELSNRKANLIALILVNLGENAIHASPSGGTVTICLSRSGRWSFEVIDEGSGMPEAIAKSLFQPGQTAREGGTGLGLSICKQLANHLGAQLELLPGLGKGCRFRLEVPEESRDRIAD